MTPTLGTCYYPEHWPAEMWSQDAQRMVEAGLTWVRIGEFAWSRIEPDPGRLDLDWLDRAIETLAAAGLKIVLGTPTATPPRWMIEKHPDMLAIDAHGCERRFGSRRHYSFSHQGYLEECRRITRILAERYGRNPAIAAWQTDNEYGCHDTTLSYCDAALRGFHDWLEAKYETIGALNSAWGNVFWSMEYRSFDEIGLPNLTVTEPNPAHTMAFRRYSSDAVVRFNHAQVEILRANSEAPILHNYMGRITDFDHFNVGEDLDIATWDNYPLGFLFDRIEGDDAYKMRYLRQGDPDFQAFHHDLYRAIGKGRMWVMEQQPGPVNWAPYNADPLPGMARLWAWEAFAHGAEVVAYFRWRQAPFSQEQMHSGLLRPDDHPAPALGEARQVANEFQAIGPMGITQAPVALIFDYPSIWAWETQPQGADFDGFRLAFEAYRTLRSVGVDVDILPGNATDFTGYGVVIASGIATIEEATMNGLRLSGARVLVGPRTNSKTHEMNIPGPLPPAIPGLDCSVSRLESLPPFAPVALENGGAFVGWAEVLEGDAPVRLRRADGQAAWVGEAMTYLAGWPDAPTWKTILTTFLKEAGIEYETMPEGLRRRQTTTHEFAFNYAPEPVEYRGETLPPAAVRWWRL